MMMSVVLILALFKIISICFNPQDDDDDDVSYHHPRHLLILSHNQLDPIVHHLDEWMDGSDYLKLGCEA